MALQKLQFTPGVNREITSLSGEGGWYDCDKVRFRFGYPEKIGGWSPLTDLDTRFLGVCRSMINWVTLADENLLGLGTHLKYYIERGGVYNDITPLRASGSVTSNAFTTVDASTTIQVNDTAHGANEGEFVTITTLTTDLDGDIDDTDTTIVADDTSGFATSGAIWIEDERITYSGVTATDFTGCTRGTGGTTAIAHLSNTTIYQDIGGVPGHAIDGNHAVHVIDANEYEIVITTAATITETVGNALFAYEIAIGGDVYTLGTGWGTGPWGMGGWGDPSTNGVGIQLRLWNHANFGEWLILGVRGGELYIWKPDANPNTFNRATALTLEAGADEIPVVHNTLLISDVSRFVICFGVNEIGSSDIDPMLIRWSDQESTVKWVPSITNQAGFRRLSNGSYIVAARQTRQEILVWTDTALYSMQYIGPPYVWNIQMLVDNVSIASPNAISVTDDAVFWMGRGNFYIYNGRSDTLPCTVRKYVFDNMNVSQMYQIVSGTNQDFNEVWWFYCSSESDNIDRYVIYNTIENLWYYGTMSRTAWLDSPLRSSPMGVVEGQVYFHENGTDDGETNPKSAISSFIQSADVDIADGDQFGIMWRIVPDITFNGSNTNLPSAFMGVRPRVSPGSEYGFQAGSNVMSDDNFSSIRIYAVERFTQYVYARARGRQMAFRVGSTTLGTQWQLGVPRIDVRTDGRR